MRRNSILGLANTLVTMAVSAEAEALYLAVADLPDGVLHIDLLARSAVIHEIALSPNHAVDRLSGWLQAEASRTRATTYQSLVEACIDLTLDSTSIPTSRQTILHFLVRPAATIRTATKRVTAELSPQHVWVRRSPGA